MDRYCTLERAWELLLDGIDVLNAPETLSLPETLGRVAASDIYAANDQPPFYRSPLDGYAVFHGDIAAASKENPAVLRVSGSVYAGDAPKGPVRSGEAVRVATGAMLPEGADCVVRQEDTDRGEACVSIYVSLKEHENYCFKGEDIRAGRCLISRGSVIDCAGIGALAGQGITQAEVFPQPRAGVLSTGSELAPAGGALPTGKIYDSNMHMLAARIKALGGVPIVGEAEADEPERLAEAVAGLLERSDIVVTTGGVSVGERDYMPRVGEILGARRIFHGVEMKPGAPALALEKDGKLILCLSGNPFAAAATFELLAVPVFRRLAGHTRVLPKRVRAIVRGSFDKPGRGRRFIRGHAEGGEVFLPEGGHASGKLASLIGCNCMVDLSAGTPPLSGGETVDIVLLDGCF